MRARFALLPLLAFLGGCAGDRGEFPSLAPRPVERLLTEEPVAAPAPAIADDPAVARRVAELLGRAREGDAAFEAAIGGARRAVAGAGAAGADGWVAAQVEITRAGAARAPTVIALAELDALAIARARQPTSAADTALVTAAVAEVQAMARRQHEQLESLRVALSPVQAGPESKYYFDRNPSAAA